MDARFPIVFVAVCLLVAVIYWMVAVGPSRRRQRYAAQAAEWQRLGQAPQEVTRQYGSGAEATQDALQMHDLGFWPAEFRWGTAVLWVRWRRQ